VFVVGLTEAEGFVVTVVDGLAEAADDVVGPADSVGATEV
jgi:hypothetical protein